MEAVPVAPVIQSFEVLSDRILNLEDGVNVLLGNARHREMRTFGTLDHRLLGLPCPTVHGFHLLFLKITCSGHDPCIPVGCLSPPPIISTLLSVCESQESKLGVVP